MDDAVDAQSGHMRVAVVADKERDSSDRYDKILNMCVCVCVCVCV